MLETPSQMDAHSTTSGAGRGCRVFGGLLVSAAAVAFLAVQRSALSAGPNGSCAGPVQHTLRWSANRATAVQIGCHNTQWAESFGYWEGTPFPTVLPAGTTEIIFYDSVTGDPLFTAPRGRSYADFIEESRRHGWPSFRNPEVNFSNVRVLRDGETVSKSGTHLGHNLPDGDDRYCINLVSVAGTPARPSAGELA